MQYTDKIGGGWPVATRGKQGENYDHEIRGLVRASRSRIDDQRGEADHQLHVSITV